MARGYIERDDEVFLDGHSHPFGAVLAVYRGREPSLSVWLENYGQIELPGSCVVGVSNGKVRVQLNKIPEKYRYYISHAHDSEAS